MKIRLVPRSEESVLLLENISCWKLHREVIAVCCENWTEEIKNVGVIPQRDLQTRRGSGSVTLLILNVGARGDADRLPQAKSTCSGIVQEDRSSPESVRTDVGKRKFLISIGVRSPKPLALSESLYQLRYPGPKNCIEHIHTNTHIYTVDKMQVFIVIHDAILTTRLGRVSISLEFITFWETMKVGRTLRYGKLI